MINFPHRLAFLRGMTVSNSRKDVTILHNSIQYVVCRNSSHSLGPKSLCTMNKSIAIKIFKKWDNNIEYVDDKSLTYEMES